MKLSKYSSKTFMIVAWSTSVAMGCYLLAVCLTVFHVNLGHVNALLEHAVQQIHWQALRDMAPNFSNPLFWIPYWCAIVLLFLYKEKVRFMFWLNRFSWFCQLLIVFLFLTNLLIRNCWPVICGRSGNFLHRMPYEDCQVFFISGAVVTALCLLSFLCLRRRHWMVKVMLAICCIVMLFSALLQQNYFPLQILAAVIIAAIAATIGYIHITVANQERFPELYNYIKP